MTKSQPIQTPHPIVNSAVNIELRPGQLPLLQTQRLLLRDIGIDDISDDYINWLNDPKINRYLEIRFTPQTRQTVTEYIKAKLADIVNSMHFGVYDQNGSRLVGTVSLVSIDHHHKTSTVGFVIGHPQAQKLGYASEALHAVTHFALTAGGLAKLWAGYYDGHQGSARVLDKNGFVVEGRLTQQLVNAQGNRVDHVLVGLLADDYQHMLHS